ncbi:MAG: hypothetical protein [Wendovervirus sonii]|uniref:Uncharacterized protein n=1 Tax=phage Lak_Megaphage_Sonny TaxID=3109229 RepID=A0ABZ0Z5J5_9CAUD|nr:MAG: hypothetical protein [phage Lak_Megaphage_Sonny]
MDKIEMPVKMAIDKLNTIIPCTLDESKLDTYKEISMSGIATEEQISQLKTLWNIDVNQMIINAATNELIMHIVKTYITDIKAFGEQTRSEHNYVLTESLTYNIDNALCILGSLHKDDTESPVIFMTTNKCKELYDNPDFIKSNNNGGYLMFYGKYKNAEVYEINMFTDNDDDFAIVCYNKDYVLHYYNDSLYRTSEQLENGDIKHIVIFNGTFINEQTAQNYLTIK